MLRFNAFGKSGKGLRLSNLNTSHVKVQPDLEDCLELEWGFKYISC
ncbi:hypothetical protein CLOSBL3_20543 [Clostridiaceae bacterium BL-3]|nr:hypothetical protein CLOSBL3_20543 [Clostridiaceae bacterium BL-3]